MIVTIILPSSVCFWHLNCLTVSLV